MTKIQINKREAALTFYGGYDNLMIKVTHMIEFYTKFSPVFNLMQISGIYPNESLQFDSPAYITDAVAYRCMNTFQEDEPAEVALERCFTEQLHADFTLMENADRTILLFEDKDWRQFGLNSLLRLVWRLRLKNTSVPFFIGRDNDNLTGKFSFDILDDKIVLNELSHNRSYELPKDAVSTFEEFEDIFCRNFKLATEDYGYFIPELVWLAN